MNTTLPPMTFTVAIECGWCGADLGTKPCAHDPKGAKTHGICPTCQDIQNKEIALLDVCTCGHTRGQHSPADHYKELTCRFCDCFKFTKEVSE